MKEKRALFFQQIPDMGQKMASLFFELFDLAPSAIIGGYWPKGSEVDVRPLLKELVRKGFMCALPAITEGGMIFRLWTESMALIQGPFHIFEPPSAADPVVPNVLLIPLLAFDQRGHRLGYGQGNFDRYLHQHPALTIGIGFRAQEITEIPHQSHDFALDYILTEEGLIAPPSVKECSRFLCSDPLIAAKKKEKSE